MYIVNLPDINNQIIKDLINEHTSMKLSRYKRLMRYYEAKHDILERTVNDPSKPNNRLVNDYPGYIIDTIQGYFIGNSVQYTSKDNAFLKDIQDIYESNNEPDHNAEIAKYMGICGEAYELLYLDDEGEIRFVRLKNEETLVVLDSDIQRSVQLALRYYPIFDATNKKEFKKVELYYPDRVEYYTQDGDTYKLEAVKEHFFGKVPVIYYNNNDERMGDFEKELTLIDDYNKKTSDSSNELEDFRNQYLKIKNMSGTSEEDLKLIKKEGAFKVDGDGDVSFVEKNVNDGYSEHHIERLDKNIHRFSKVPNLSDEQFGGNLSGVAIKFKLWPIEQIAACKERKFKTGLKRRIKLIAEILRIKGKNYNWKDIKITMKRNIPANILEAAQVATNMKGIISDETLLGQLPFIEDAAAELGRIKAEQEDGQDYSIFKTKKAVQNNSQDSNLG